MSTTRPRLPARRAPVLLGVTCVVFAFGVAICVGVWRASTTPSSAAVAPSSAAVTPAPSMRQIDLGGDADAGRRLYVEGCAACHGLEGEGVEGRGPSLENAGEAAADFYLTSGRMPASTGTGDQPLRKPPAYSPEQIADLVAYVGQLGDGPPIPDIDPADGDLALGQQLYTANCAGCHNSAGSGGALGQGFYAPAVMRATDVQVAEAVRVGPGAMPAFGEGVIDDHELASIVRYVDYLRDPVDPGGFSLGRIGPVTEGMVAWLVGMAALIIAARLIGTRQ
jgi:ubiquinol-cytochrome c reductase cytochrome c subunit